MRVIVASADDDAAGWLRGVLGSAGLTVAVLPDPAPTSPELAHADLVIADQAAMTAIGGAGPERRVLLVARGQAVDIGGAMSGGYMDVVIVPAPEDEVLARVGRVLDQFLKPMKVAEGSRAKSRELKTIVDRVAFALKKGKRAKDSDAYVLAEGMLSVFLLMIDSHESTDRGTPGHSKRTGTLVRRIATNLGFAPEEISWLELAGRIHDIGLLPLEIPMKDAAPLSLDLRRTLSAHPKISEEILEPIQRWGLPVQAIRWHHERLDGSGYPDGLEGDQIPVPAQILGAADAFEALTSPRPWRPAEPPEAALEAMRAGGGFLEDVLRAMQEPIADERAGRGGTVPPLDAGG